VSVILTVTNYLIVRVTDFIHNFSIYTSSSDQFCDSNFSIFYLLFLHCFSLERVLERKKLNQQRWQFIVFLRNQRQSWRRPWSVISAAMANQVCIIYLFKKSMYIIYMIMLCFLWYQSFDNKYTYSHFYWTLRLWLNSDFICSNFQINIQTAFCFLFYFSSKKY